MSSKTNIKYYVNLPTKDMVLVTMWLDLCVKSYKITEVLDYWTRNVKQLIVYFETQADANKFKEFLSENKL